MLLLNNKAHYCIDRLPTQLMLCKAQIFKIPFVMNFSQLYLFIIFHFSISSRDHLFANLEVDMIVIIITPPREKGTW